LGRGEEWGKWDFLLDTNIVGNVGMRIWVDKWKEGFSSRLWDHDGQGTCLPANIPDGSYLYSEQYGKLEMYKMRTYQDHA
jgi:hypothetical protein